MIEHWSMQREKQHNTERRHEGEKLGRRSGVFQQVEAAEVCIQMIQED